MITNLQLVDDAQAVTETEELTDLELSLNELDMVGGGSVSVIY
jgi:hypothetical protein